MMLNPGDMHMLAHNLYLAAHYYAIAADEVWPTSCNVQQKIAAKYFGKALEIIKSKDEPEEVSEGGRTPTRRMENDDGQKLHEKG